MSEHTANDLRLYSETTINELVAANWAMDDEIKKLKAENAKLREALKAIESGDLYHPEKSARRALLGGGE